MSVKSNKLSWIDALQQKITSKHAISSLRQLWIRSKLSVQVGKERNQLRKLPPHLLADIGISREDAIHEAKRSPSDIPEQRLAMTCAATQQADRYTISA